MQHLFNLIRNSAIISLFCILNSELQPSITLQQPLQNVENIHQAVLVVKNYSQSPWLSGGTGTKDRGLLVNLQFYSHVQKV